MPVLTRSQENQFVSNITGRKHSTIDIKRDEVHCKLQNCVYLLTCTNSGIEYIGESITPLNLRINIRRSGKSEC